MHFIRVEVRPTPAVFSLGCSVAPLFFVSVLGLFTSICFSLASALLFVSFVIIPKLAKDKCKNFIFQHRREPPRYYEKELSDILEAARQNISGLYKGAGTLYIVGLIAFAMSH